MRRTPIGERGAALQFALVAIGSVCAGHHAEILIQPQQRQNAIAQQQNFGFADDLDAALGFLRTNPQQLLDVDLRNGKTLAFSRDDERGNDSQRQRQLDTELRTLAREWS